MSITANSRYPQLLLRNGYSLRSNNIESEEFNMAKTAAQRQSEYRARRDNGDCDYRINTWVTSTADFALSRLAKRHGTTRRQILEQLICDADDVIINSLELDTPEWNTYFITR